MRDFHDQEKLIDLIAALNKIKKDNAANIPLLLKISPDINNSHIPEISDAAKKIIFLQLYLQILQMVIEIS